MSRVKIKLDNSKVIELLDQGMGQAAIGNKLGVSRGCIRRVLSELCLTSKYQIKLNDKNSLWINVEADDLSGCWNWKGRKNNHGYGQIGYLGKVHFTHRLAYIFDKGEIPEGYDVCHKCDNPICCNPSHLFLGTRRENMIDCTLKGRNSVVKLDASKVIEIRNHKSAGMSQVAIAKIYNVSPTAIYDIISRKTWDFV